MRAPPSDTAPPTHGLKVIHASTSDGGGGAARSAYRIHRALLSHPGVTSMMLVRDAITGDNSVSQVRRPKKPARAFLRLARWIERISTVDRNRIGAEFRSPGIVGVCDHSVFRVLAPEVVHLHWVSGLLSIESIGRIPCPVVWTLHDMWAFCGTEHYAAEDAEARWRTGYGRRSRPASAAVIDIDRLTWLRKRRSWRTPFTVVTPSRWLGECASSSQLLGSAPVHVIPYAIDTEFWRPIPQLEARRALDLPPEPKIVLFGAASGLFERRKGGDLLSHALHHLPLDQVADLRLALFGPNNRRSTPVHPEIPIPVHFLGQVSDDRLLRLAYSAADVMVVPSRQDNLPNTAVEAQSCGIPVVAFDVGGLPDIVEHRMTGFLSQPFDPTDLAEGIRWVLDHGDSDSGLRRASREAAKRKFEPKHVAEAYIRVYEDAIRGSCPCR